MKKIIIIINIAFLFMLLGCKEDELSGSLEPVSNVEVIPFFGSVKLQWTNPNNEDYYYTLVSYVNSNGDIVNKKISNSTSDSNITKTIFGGFDEIKTYQLTLTSFGYSGAKSSSVVVDATPESPDKAKDYVLSTMEISPNYSGCLLSWINDTGVDLKLVVSYVNVAGEPTIAVVDASKSGTYQLIFGEPQTISYHISSADGNASTSDKIINVIPLGNPDDIINPLYEYIIWGNGANTVTFTTPNTENPYEFIFETSGADPYISCFPFKTNSTGKSLKFRYKCNKKWTAEFFWCNPSGGPEGGRSDAVELEATTEWKTVELDMTNIFVSRNWTPGIGYFFRFDCGSEPGLTIHIRNMHFE